MDLLPALVVSALLLHEKPGIMLLWYLTYLVADFMFSEVGLLLEALVPASAMDTVKSMIQILLRCIILVIVAVFLAIGYFFGRGFSVYLCSFCRNRRSDFTDLSMDAASGQIGDCSQVPL